MKLIRKTTIYHPKSWGKHKKYFDISRDGQLIVVRVRDTWDNRRPDNVFVYDTNDQLVVSFRSGHGGEDGVAFWPDKYHVLTPGHNTGSVHDRRDDGLKCQQLGSNNFTDFTVPLSDTSLSGINIQLHGTSDNGRYILGHQGEYVCIDTHKNNAAILIRKQIFGQVFFSSNDRFVGGYEMPAFFVIKETYFDPTGPSGFIIELPSGKVVWEYGFLCFSPEGTQALCPDSPSDNQDVNLKHAIAVLDLLTYKIISHHPVSKRVITAAYSPNGKWLVTGEDIGDVCLRNTIDYTVETRLNLAHSTPIQQIKFSFDGAEVITISREDIIVWSLV